MAADDVTLKLQLLDEFTATMSSFTDKLKKAESESSGFSRSASASITAVATSITALGTVASGIGGVLSKAFGAVKSVVSTVATGVWDFAKSVVASGSEWESLSTRMNALTGSAKAGKEAMDFLAERAAKLPYTLNEVIEGGTGIKAFGMEIKKWMTPLADVAAFMNISLPEAASAMGRAFSGGAGAADVFRERGVLELVKSFAKVDDLTKLTLPQFREAMYKTFTDGKTGIMGMSDALGNTLAGRLSTLQDYWDGFKRKVSEDVFPKIKAALGLLMEEIDSLSKNGTLDQWAKLFGTAMSEVFSTATKFVSDLYAKIKEMASDGSLSRWLNEATEKARSLWNSFIDMIPRAIVAAGSAAQAALEIAAAFTEVKSAAGEALVELGWTFLGMTEGMRKLIGVTTEAATSMTVRGAEMQESANQAKQRFQEMGEEIKTRSMIAAGSVSTMAESFKVDAKKSVTAFDFLKTSVDTSMTWAAKSVDTLHTKLGEFAETAPGVWSNVTEGVLKMTRAVDSLNGKQIEVTVRTNYVETISSIGNRTSSAGSGTGAFPLDGSPYGG